MLRQRRVKALGSSTAAARAIVAHPLAFGAMAGIGNGVLAAIRNKPMSLAANLVTAAVIGISEGMLAGDPNKAFETSMLSLAGATVGMAPFTRFDAAQRALIERRSAPTPF